ncbi:hypothetical protein QBC46DRAFT_290637 [Diplogelasinospora grovesii]|uniref:Uncharacterized protein n=1 Tax=Diplogelasinospora grovesii TaxID=303347 RepID=A0AAN6N552_9PEZI|nr:hypothetical protein QBC46DRAFT_290637 [Diplogelasinospora grovesii]
MSPSTAETTGSESAISIITILRTADAPGEALTSRLNEEVGAEGWSEWLAEQVLHTLEATLGEENMEPWGQALKDAYDSTIKLAQEEFKTLVEYVKEHPLEVAAGVLFSLVAFGVLARLMPWVLRLLGFGELGPVEGSFAARWQATYAGFVPKESLFSYLQRLGMIVTN